MRRSTPPAAFAVDRRTVIAGSATALAGSMLPAAVASAEPTADYVKVRGEILNGRAITAGRVRLDIPRIAESGNSVPVAVSVASPMTEADHVRTIHILSEQNPYALIARLHLGPRAGVAEVRTNIRLATTQLVHAIAEMSDGALYEAEAETVVALAACLDGS